MLAGFSFPRAGTAAALFGFGVSRRGSRNRPVSVLRIPDTAGSGADLGRRITSKAFEE